jgi:GT2 family glycosyltransferase
MGPLNDVVVVAIGRNEGDRLKRCLRSVMGVAHTVVYVDSNSIDDSVGFARDLGVVVIELDLSMPFTAARARNEGFAKALSVHPQAQFVQFVDGDCEITPDWLQQARLFLQAHPEVAVTCGRRRERHPQASVYNQLCDLEWNTPIGPALACGGDAMMRVSALKAADGYRGDVIAGEEPELCVRLRQLGWKIWRLDADMTWHDAAMTQFKQWRTRAKRCGYAYALGSHLHGAPPERHWVSETRRALLWGGFLPAVCLTATLCLGAWGLMAWLIYPAQVMRLGLRSPLDGILRWQNATFTVLGKFPEAWGIWRFWRDHWQRRSARIIEYK